MAEQPLRKRQVVSSTLTVGFHTLKGSLSIRRMLRQADQSFVRHVVLVCKLAIHFTSPLVPRAGAVFGRGERSQILPLPVHCDCCLEHAMRAVEEYASKLGEMAYRPGQA